MLHEFIRTNRKAIVANAQARATTSYSQPYPENGISVFLDQLGDALDIAVASDVINHEQIGRSASRHGNELQRTDLTVGQVVHVYGAVCQAITDLATRLNAPIEGAEFQTLNLCLDDAIAGAVTEYSHQRELAIEGTGNERLGVLAHELRNALSAAMLSFQTIKSGQVGVLGSTGKLLERCLMNLQRLIDRSMAEVRLEAGIQQFERIPVAELVDEVEVVVTQQTGARGIGFKVGPVAPVVAVEGDRQILAAILSNLLQNAVKFTHKGGRISLTTRVTDTRVLFDIEDECGGLPSGNLEERSRPFEQRGSDRTGAGLGLSICIKGAKANRGEVRVQNLPGQGCIFTLDLPRSPPPGPPMGSRETSTQTPASGG
jgi:signal transduction histidine kinase